MHFSFKILYTLLLVSFFLISCNSGTGQASKTTLSVDDFEKELTKTPNAQLVDVRTPDEYKQGHVKGAKNIDYNDDAFATNITALDKTKPTFVYCLAGSRSQSAAALMRQNGFTKVYEMDGGLMKWNAANKPLETGTEIKKTVSTINDTEFQQKLKDNAVVLVDFGATWCRPCKMQAPIVDSIAEKNQGKLLLIKVDVDQSREFTQKMQVTELPTLLLFKNGKQVWRSEGLMPADMILDAIKNK